MKKEDDRYYINSKDGWEEVDLGKMSIQILNKHQEVLVRCKSTFIENKDFRKVLEFYFESDDEFKLIVEVNEIELHISNARLQLLNQTLDYELENMERLDRLEMDHENNIIK